MNNGNFALTRYLRDEGVDAHLLLFDKKLEHFHPSRDTYDDARTRLCTSSPGGVVPRFLPPPGVDPQRPLRVPVPHRLRDGAGLRRTGLGCFDVFVPFGVSSGPTPARPTPPCCAT